ncbi:MAG: helix-turn-helix transcriptional regulator [Saprospirales bacterium]|nr:helix-turn-helix transcriptional regulator [Saprospirales bacterium]
MKTDRLEEIRRDLGLNKAQMAELMGIEASYYSNILKGEGKGNLRLEHLERLLNDANVNPLWIMTGEGEKYLLDQLGLVVSVYLRVIVRFPTIDLVNLLGLNDVAATLSK